MVLVSTAPLFVAVLSALFLRERPGRRQWLGIVLAVAGAAWIGWGDFRGVPARLRGDLVATAGAVLVAGYYVIGRKLRARIDLWPFVGVVYGSAALTLLLALPLAGVPLTGYPPRDWALRYLPAYVVNLSLPGEPVGATLIAWLPPAIAEIPPPAALAGGALILCGILLGVGRR